MGRRSGLGKGLGALIPTAERLEDEEAQLREVPISEIEPNRYQPREHFDEEGLVSLSASIQAVGVLQPVLVRQTRARTLRAHRGGAALARRPSGRPADDPCAGARDRGRPLAASRPWSRTSTGRT